MSTATTAQVETTLPAEDEDRPLPLRGDTFLGVCEAVGQDLGIHPNWLRIPFAALLLWNPLVIVATYLGLGFVVALSRWLYPAKRKTAAPKLVSASQPAAGQKREDEELAIAA